MEANVEFYGDWFKWVEARSAQLAKKEPLQLLGLLSDVKALVQQDVTVWQSLGQVLHGNAIDIAVKVGIWVSHNPDPLKGTRESMRAIRAKYGEVVPDVHK